MRFLSMFVLSTLLNPVCTCIFCIVWRFVSTYVASYISKETNVSYSNVDRRSINVCVNWMWQRSFISYHSRLRRNHYANITKSCFQVEEAKTIVFSSLGGKRKRQKILKKWEKVKKKWSELLLQVVQIA